jgi:flagellar biosynthesis chaperone FliJ
MRLFSKQSRKKSTRRSRRSKGLKQLNSIELSIVQNCHSPYNRLRERLIQLVKNEKAQRLRKKEEQKCTDDWSTANIYERSDGYISSPITYGTYGSHGTVVLGTSTLSYPLTVRDSYNTLPDYMKTESQKNTTNNQFNNNTKNKINMNDTVGNQKQTTETSAIKYLTEKRTEASPVMEFDKKEYIKLIEENAKLKADTGILRYEETFDSDTVISYTGKDKAISAITEKNEFLTGRIRNLETDIQVANEINDNQRKTFIRKTDNFETATIRKQEDLFDIKNKQLIKDHRNEVKDLNNAIEDCNDSIREANERNKILSDMNTRYKDTLLKIVNFATKRVKMFKIMFGLNILTTAMNDYKVVAGKGMRSLYIDSDDGYNYFA